MDAEISNLRGLIAAGQATPQAASDLAYLLQRREALLKLMTSDGPTRDIEPPDDDARRMGEPFVTKQEKTRLQNLRAKKKSGRLFDPIEIKRLARLEAAEAELPRPLPK